MTGMQLTVTVFVLFVILAQYQIVCDGMAENETYVTHHEATKGCFEEHKSVLIPQHFMDKHVDVRKEIIQQMNNMTAWIDGQKVDIGCMEGKCYSVLKQRTHTHTRRPFICGTSILGFKSNVTYSEAETICDREANVTFGEVMTTLTEFQIEENITMWLFNVLDIEGDNTCASIKGEDKYELPTQFQSCEERMMGVCIEHSMVADYELSVTLLLENQDIIIMAETSFISRKFTEQSTEKSTNATIILVSQDEVKDIVPFSTFKEQQTNSIFASSPFKRIEFLAFLTATAFSFIILFFILILLWKRISRIERHASLNSKRFAGSNFLLDVPEHIYNACGDDTIPKWHRQRKKRKAKNFDDKMKHQYLKIPVERYPTERECQDFEGDAENPYAELSLLNELKESRDDLNELRVINGDDNRASYIDMKGGMSTKDLTNSSSKVDNKNTSKEEGHSPLNLYPKVAQNGMKMECLKPHKTFNTFFPGSSIVVDKTQIGHLINKTKTHSFGKSMSDGKSLHRPGNEQKGRAPQLPSINIGTNYPPSLDQDQYMEMRIPK